jgi:hypothetical protein
MTRAATGEANLLSLSGHGTTSYLCELGHRRGLFRSRRSRRIAARVQCSGNAAVAADRPGARPFSAPRQPSLACDSHRIILRQCHFSWFDDAFRLACAGGRDHGRSAVRCLADQSLGAPFDTNALRIMLQATMGNRAASA